MSFFLALTAAPSNVRVKSLNEGKIIVLWDPVKKQLSNGRIQGYRVYYSQISYYWYSETIINITDPNVRQTVLSGLNEGRTYQVTVAAYTLAGQGPRSRRVIITAGEY